MTGSIPPACTNSGSDSWDRMPTSGWRAERRSPTRAAPWHWNTATQAGDGALDRLLEDDVGLVEAGRGPVAGVVADLDPEGRAGRARPLPGPGSRSAGRWRPARGRRSVVVAADLGRRWPCRPLVATTATTTPITTTATPPSRYHQARGTPLDSWACGAPGAEQDAAGPAAEGCRHRRTAGPDRVTPRSGSGWSAGRRRALKGEATPAVPRRLTGGPVGGPERAVRSAVDGRTGAR